MGLLQKFFGPSKEEIWRQLCDEIGATYIEGDNTKLPRVQASHENWVITLDSYMTPLLDSQITHTRLRAPYINQDNFRFTVTPQGVLTNLARKLGMQDVEVGYPDFDQRFVIQGTDELKLRRLFAEPRIRELLLLQPEVQFSVLDSEGFWGPEFPPDTDELQFVIGHEVRDLERLKQLFELFALTLDQLCDMGSAYESAPDLKL